MTAQSKKDPSKMSSDQLKQHFLKLQNAFEILSDEATRRQYDSSLTFDDTLPTAAEISADNFYKVCGEAFIKEAKWSEKKPVPLLGDANTPLPQVKKFYQFWLREFTSWRDFSSYGEYELEEAQDREERRWMQKENWKVVSKYVKQERERVFRFVTLAESKDPRLQAEKEADRQKREKAKAEKAEKLNAAKRQAEEEKRQKNEAERIQAETEAKEKADAKRNEKKHIQELRRKIRGFYRTWCEDRGLLMEFTADDLQDFCVNSNVEFLSCMADTLAGIANGRDPEIDMNVRSEVSTAIRGVMNEWHHSRYKKSFTAVPELISPAASVRVTSPSRTDTSGIAPSRGNTALPISPLASVSGPVAGTSKNAPQHAQMPGHSNTTGQKSAPVPSTAGTGEKKPQSRSWSLEELSLLSKALVKYPGGTVNRWQQIAKFLGPEYTADEVLAQTKIINDSRNLKQPNAVVSAEQKAAFEASHIKIEAAPDTRDSSTQPDWSSEQQTALEKALAKFPPGGDPAQRWRNIAGDVPGKNARECLSRFREIKEAILAANKLNKA